MIVFLSIIATYFKREATLEIHRTLIMSRLRIGAYQAGEATIEYGGGDPAELVALIQHIAARENCTAECAEVPDQHGLLSVAFKRTTGVSHP